MDFIGFLKKRARGVVESVCRQNAKPRPPEKFVYLKSGPEGSGGVQEEYRKGRNISTKTVKRTIVSFYRLTRLRTKNTNI